MVQFTPYQGTPNAPNYNTSREIDPGKPNTTAATAITGAANVFSLGVNALDDINKSNIDKELRKQIDAERGENIATGLELMGGAPTALQSTSTDASTYDTTSATVSRNSPTEAVPPQVEQGLRRAGMIAQANRQGKFDDVNYYGNMQTIFQGLISKYPGYTEYIHQKGASILGTNPANAQRAAIQSSLAQIQGAATRADERWINDVEKWMPILGEEGTRAALAAVGNPAKQAEFRAYVARVQSAKYRIDFEKDELGLKSAKGQATAEDAERALTNIAFQTSGNVMEGFMFKLNGNEIGANNIIRYLNERRLSGNPASADELNAIGAQLGDLENGKKKAWQAIISEPRYKDAQGRPTTLAAIINNPTKLAQMEEQFMAPTKLMIRHVGAGRLDSATAVAEWTKAIKENNVARAASIPAFQVMQGVSDYVGPQGQNVLNTYYTMTKWEGIKEGHKALLDMTATSTSGGLYGRDVRIGMEGTRKIIEQGTGEPAPPVVNRVMIDQARFGVTQTDDPKIALNWANHIASGGTTEFIAKMDRNQQVDVWASIAAPDVSASIKKLDASNPGVWKRYRDWVELNAERLFGRDFADVQQAAMLNRRLNVEWNENGRIDYSDPRSTSRLGPQRSTGQGFEPIDRVNKVLGILREVYKLDGEKIDASTLQRFGLDLNKKYETPWLDGLVKSIRKTINEAAEGSEGPRLFRDNPSRRTGGESNTIPIGAIPNMGPPQPFEPDTLGASYNRFDEAMEALPDRGANEPLLAEGQRRLQGFPLPR